MRFSVLVGGCATFWKLWFYRERMLLEWIADAGLVTDPRKYKRRPGGTARKIKAGGTGVVTGKG